MQIIQLSTDLCAVYVEECTLPTEYNISLKMKTLQGVRIVILLAPCIVSASVNVEKLVHHFHIDKILESLQQRNPQLQPGKVLRSLDMDPVPAAGGSQEGGLHHPPVSAAGDTGLLARHLQHRTPGGGADNHAY